MAIRLPMLRAAALAALLVAGCGPRPVELSAGPGGSLRVVLPFEPQTLAPNAARDEIALFLSPPTFSASWWPSMPTPA